MVLARAVASGCGRLRTVADVNATSSQHTLNPQTPRVKREPLLRIPEKTEIWLQSVGQNQATSAAIFSGHGIASQYIRFCQNLFGNL